MADRKPLVLTVYPHRWISVGPYSNPSYVTDLDCFILLDGAIIDVRDIPDKRLTGAELAAEYWHARYAVHLHAANGVLSRRYFYEACVLEQFATLPSYDEGDDDE